MDLFHSHEEEMIGEWNEIKENYSNSLPNRKSCKLKVRLSNKLETFAYFYEDKCQWIGFYGQKPCYFWDCKTKEPLHNVTHWKSLREKLDE